MNGRGLGGGRLRRSKKGDWVADYRGPDGKRHRKALSSDKRVAERVFADLIKQRDLCIAGLAIEEGLDLPARDLVDDFLVELRARRTPAYVERVEGILARVVDRMKVARVRDFTPAAFLLYRRQRLGDGIANRTANHELTVTRTLLNWAVRARFIGFNPLQGLQQLPAGRGYEKHPRRALSDEEIERLLAAAEQVDREATSHALAEKSIAIRHTDVAFAERERVPRVPQSPMWITLLETGARIGEIAKVTWGDFSESSATLTLRASTTKSRAERRIPLRKALVERLVTLRVLHHAVRGRLPKAGDSLFVTPTGQPWLENRRHALRRLEQLLARAGIAKFDERGEKVDVHSLRHTFASRLARNGVGLVQAQKLLGHSDPKLTAQVYVRMDAEDLRAAVESMPPVSSASA